MTFLPPRLVVSVSVPTRPDLLRVIAMVRTGPVPNSLPRPVAVNVRGTQRWYTAIASPGSSTATRYGTGGPLQMSSTLAVRPPEDEKKNAVMTLFL